MKSPAVVIWLLILGLAAASYGAFLTVRKRMNTETAAIESGEAGHSSRRAGKFEMGPPVTYTFKLTDQDGKEFDSTSLKGKVWIGSFFFANCPGPCFRLNQALAGIDNEFAKQGVELISVTCDPKNDTPEALKKYSERFLANSKSWKFLTGDMTTIMLVGEQVFKLTVAENIHSEKCVVFDRQMRMRGVFNCLNEDDVVRLRELLTRLVVEESEPVAASTATPEPKATAQAAAAVSK